MGHVKGKIAIILHIEAGFYSVSPFQGWSYPSSQFQSLIPSSNKMNAPVLINDLHQKIYPVVTSFKRKYNYYENEEICYSNFHDKFY